MKIITRIKANKVEKVVLIAGNTLNTKVVQCIQKPQFMQIQIDRTLKMQRKIQQQ
jgi:hypothetical protein